MNTTATFPAARATPHAAHAFGGIWRLTARRYFNLGHWLMLLGMIAALVLFAMAQRHMGGGIARYAGWIGGFYICFLVPVLAFISGGGVVRDDLQADSADYIFTRAIRRWQFVLFRFLAHVACAQLDFLLALSTLVGLGVLRDAPGMWGAVPLLLLAQVLVIVAFSAFGFLSGMITSRFVIIGLVYGGIVEVGIGNVPTQLNRLSMIRQILELLRPVMGGADSEMVLSATDAVVSPPLAALSLAGFAAVMLAAAIAIFSFREFAGAGRDA